MTKAYLSGHIHEGLAVQRAGHLENYFSVVVMLLLL